MCKRGTFHVAMTSEGKVTCSQLRRTPPSETMLGENCHSKSLREVASLLHHLREIYVCVRAHGHCRLEPSGFTIQKYHHQDEATQQQ